MDRDYADWRKELLCEFQINVTVRLIQSKTFVLKGQLISKCLFGIFNSPKKMNEKIRLQVELFSFVFWENWKHQKDILKLTDL